MKEEECKCGGNCNCKKECKCNHETKLKKNKLKEMEEKHLLEINDLKDKYMRLQAEYLNYQKRTREEFSDFMKYDGEAIIKELLPIIDNLERAIMLDDNDLSDDVSKFLSGIKMIYTSIMSLLEKLEVKVIDCSGKEFDPIYMEAMLVEHDENKPENVVLEVLTKGYIYKDKVIRTSMVKVNK